MRDDSHDLTAMHISGDEVIGEIIAARAKLAQFAAFTQSFPSK
jgi:hypothetical protein